MNWLIAVKTVAPIELGLGLGLGFENNEIHPVHRLLYTKTKIIIFKILSIYIK